MKKILLIEDDPDQILMYQTKFELEGVKISVASSIKEGMDTLNKERPSLVLLDLLLKDEDGLDLLSAIKQNDSLKDIPVIIFTNFDTSEEREKAKRLGAVSFIIKSQTTPGETVQRVKEMLNWQ